MERLTIPDVRVDEHTTQRAFIDAEAVREHAMEFYWRLKAFEDTEPDPEKVAWMKEVIEMAFDHDTSRLRRAHDLHVADREGRVVVLPCKVGDMVYRTWSVPEHAPFVEEVRMSSVAAIISLLRKFGKTVFLTRKEAEKALQEMQRKEDANGTDDKPK